MSKTTQKNNTVYMISGPTASGKSKIAFYLAKRINGEIVNCDSVQLYKYLDIGSAKPTKKEMAEIPHHLYGIIDPKDKITVAQYQKIAFHVIDDILSRGKTPIVVGGAGLYLNSILYDMTFAAKPRSEKRRKELEEMTEKNGKQYMFEYLSAVDPDAAARTHPNNIKKVIRAIEAWELGDNVKPISECQINPNYTFKLYGLSMDRKWLYSRINKRVLEIVQDGLIDEIKGLIRKGYTNELPALQTIGYKEIFPFLNGECSLKESINEIMKNTRHYAKRQITWLKRYEHLQWIEIRKGQSLGSVIDEILAK